MLLQGMWQQWLLGCQIAVFWNSCYMTAFSILSRHMVQRCDREANLKRSGVQLGEN